MVAVADDGRVAQLGQVIIVGSCYICTGLENSDLLIRRIYISTLHHVRPSTACDGSAHRMYPAIFLKLRLTRKPFRMLFSRTFNRLVQQTTLLHPLTFTSQRTKIVVWLYDNIDMRIEGRIIVRVSNHPMEHHWR